MKKKLFFGRKCRCRFSEARRGLKLSPLAAVCRSACFLCARLHTVARTHEARASALDKCHKSLACDDGSKAFQGI